MPIKEKTGLLSLAKFYNLHFSPMNSPVECYAPYTQPVFSLFMILLYRVQAY
ncbi:MAG: hypothetical protein H6Q68_1228 [Firmicutes bacterium]|nr:hypothetical protein [Bacillota bacterium]